MKTPLVRLFQTESVGFLLPVIYNKEVSNFMKLKR